MFESPGEVQRTMIELKILEAVDTTAVEEEEEEGEFSPQEFPDHVEQEQHFRRSLYYGALPATDRPSLPLTRLAVDRFTDSGLDALGQKLGRLDVARAADITRQACAGPNSLVLALLYLERLRGRNPDYLTTVSSADLFLVSLMVASKFLHDDGEEDEVFNDEWASSGGMDTKELNRLEVSFLAALDWRILVQPAEFQATLQRLEADIAAREVAARTSGATYSDLTSLGSGEQASHLLALLAQAAIKVTAVCLTTYAAGLLTLLGTAAALSRTPLGPAAVTSSVRTLASACRGLQEDLGPEEPREEPRAVSGADLVTASLLVATLASGDYYTGDPGQADPATEEDHAALEEERQHQLNRTHWLAEEWPTPPGRTSYSDLPAGRATYSAPVYRDRPDPGTMALPSALPTALPAALPTWQEQRALLTTLQRCPVLRWGAQAAAWPALGITAG